MLYREIIAVGSEIHTKHINTLCGQNVEFVNIKSCGTYSKHWAFFSPGVTTPIRGCILQPSSGAVAS